jgi:uncharacterized protein (DUF302 family)/uncharacterized membrane protein YidH (DUF202 family)
MDAPRETGERTDLRDYLAAERTLLAWLRTGLALMGFGFVVARFGLFLQELQIAEHAPAVHQYGLSLWFGTALIWASVAVNLLSARHHIQLVRTFNLDPARHPPSTIFAVSTSLFLALVGLVMAIYLVSVPNSASANAKEASMAQPAQASTKGIIDRPSKHSVDETVNRLTNILQAKGVKLFALVDHSGEAEKVGLKMPPTKLLIFGSPKAGTPLMLAAPSMALDLPLKILVWESGEGKVWISYNSPAYLRERHNLPQNLLENISVVELLAEKAGE